MSDNILIKSGTWKKMIFLSKKYLKIWVVGLFILLCSAVYGGYRYYYNDLYDKLLNKADSYMEKGEYKKAVDVYEKVLKYKNDKQAEKNIKKAKEKLDEASKTQIKDKIEDNTDKNSNYSDSEIDNITEEQAVELISKCYKTKNENTKFVFDHEDIRDNETYYVIQVFDSMEDHSATTGWYYVSKKSGKAYEWDLAENKLISIK